MKLVVGLGNPGSEYENTRHNIGFMMVDYYLKYKGISDSWKKKFNGFYLECNFDGEKVIFLKPQSYMNLSGGVIKRFIDFYKIEIEDILIISDDLDLLVGNFKLREKGSCGGHNGLKDIERNLNTQEYKRLRIGISNDKILDTKDYVLGKITKKDLDRYYISFDTINKLLDDYFLVDFSKLISSYNRKNR